MASNLRPPPPRSYVEGVIVVENVDEALCVNP